MNSTCNHKCPYKKKAVEDSKQKERHWRERYEDDVLLALKMEEGGQELRSTALEMKKKASNRFLPKSLQRECEPA